jgi:hypothetical protein
MSPTLSWPVARQQGSAGRQCRCPQQPLAHFNHQSLLCSYLRACSANNLEGGIADDADQAARIIQDALGTESDDVVNYCFPKT